MTTFDEHSRDEVFRDYLNEAATAQQHAANASAAADEHVPFHIGRGQIHATLAHAAATLLAAMPEVQYRAVPFGIEGPESEADQIRTERDALRDRVDELAAAGLTKYKDAGRVVAQTGSMPEKHEPGTAPLCTCGHHSDQHPAVTLPEGDFVLLCKLCDCKRYTPAPPSRTPLCTCGHHVDRHFDGPRSMRAVCDDCPCLAYTPNTSEVDGWSEPDARGARFRVARFEQNDHRPPVYFKVTDQLGKQPTVKFANETMAQAHADYLNRTFPSTSTDASVATEAQSSSALDSTEPLVRAAADAMGAAAGDGWDDPEEPARAAVAAVLRSLSDRYSTADLTGMDALYRKTWLGTGEWLLKMATALEQHTDTPTTE